MYAPSLILISKVSTVLRALLRAFGLPASHLSFYRVPLVLFPYPFMRMQGFGRSNRNDFKDLSRFSNRGLPQFPYHIGSCNFVCCQQDSINQFQPHNHFPAPSICLRFSSVFPNPTLMTDVVISAPRTRCGRLVRPYPVGFPHSISLACRCAEFLMLTSGNQCFHVSQSALCIDHTDSFLH